MSNLTVAEQRVQCIRLNRVVIPRLIKSSKPDLKKVEEK